MQEGCLKQFSDKTDIGEQAMYTELLDENVQLQSDLHASQAQLKKAQKAIAMQQKQLKDIHLEVVHVLQSEFSFSTEYRLTIHAIIGNGYRTDESGQRLLRLHAADIVLAIEAKSRGARPWWCTCKQ